VTNKKKMSPKFDVYESDGEEIVFIETRSLEQTLDFYSKYEGNSVTEVWHDDGVPDYLKLGDLIFKRVV